MRYTIFSTLILGIFATTGFNVNADILFQDDFESGKIDAGKWAPQAVGSLKTTMTITMPSGKSA